MQSASPSRQVLQREQEHHDRWAAGVRVEDVRVREVFEAPTAPENRFILKLIGDLHGKRLLDLGAGLGESAVCFALRGADVTVADLSPQMVEFALRLGEHHGVKLTGVVSAGESLNLEDRQFDIVYAANLIHHVTDRDRLFQEIHRVLKPQGHFFAYDPLAYNPAINVYRRMASEVRSQDERPITFQEMARAKRYFRSVRHREFWILTLALFLKYYMLDRVHPNQDRYWKRALKETPRRLWWWYPLYAADTILTRLPVVRRLAWNTVIWAQKGPPRGTTQ